MFKCKTSPKFSGNISIYPLYNKHSLRAVKHFKVHWIENLRLNMSLKLSKSLSWQFSIFDPLQFKRKLKPGQSPEKNKSGIEWRLSDVSFGDVQCSNRWNYIVQDRATFRANHKYRIDSEDCSKTFPGSWNIPRIDTGHYAQHLVIQILHHETITLCFFLPLYLIGMIHI